MTEKAAYLAGRRNLRREVEVIGVGILLHEVVVGNVQIQRAAVGDEAVGLRGGSGEITVSGVFVGIPETQPRSRRRRRRHRGASRGGTNVASGAIISGMDEIIGNVMNAGTHPRLPRGLGGVLVAEAVKHSSGVHLNP